MDDYFQKFSLLKEKIIREKQPVCSQKTLLAIIQEEFKRSLVQNSPPEIYGKWEEHIALRNKLSSLYFQPGEEPLEILPKKELMLSNWIYIAPFLKQHHSELLWYLEKERFIIQRGKEINLDYSEKDFKEKATAALYKNDRQKALRFFSSAIVGSPKDVTMHTDMAFLTLNEERNTKKALMFFEKACKLIQEETNLYCFLKMQINMIKQIEGNFLDAYIITEDLAERFRSYNEVVYQHGINAINSFKENEGFLCLGRAFENNINYALKAYEEIKTPEHSETLSRIFQELVEKKEEGFYNLNQSRKAIFSESKRIKIMEWVPDAIRSLESDLEIINTLGNSRIYINIAAAQYFIQKTPKLLILKITEKLQEKAKKELKQNAKAMKEIRIKLKTKLNAWEKYNQRGVITLIITTLIIFAYASYQKDLLFALSFSIIYASILLIVIGINVLHMHKLKASTNKEINSLEDKSNILVSKYKDKTEEFKDAIHNASGT